MKPLYFIIASTLILMSLSCTNNSSTSITESIIKSKNLRPERLIYEQRNRKGRITSYVKVEYLNDLSSDLYLIRYQTVLPDEPLDFHENDQKSEIRIDKLTGSIIYENLYVDETRLDENHRGFTGFSIKREKPDLLSYEIRIKDGPESGILTQEYRLNPEYPLYTVNSLVLACTRIFDSGNYPVIYLFLQGGTSIPVEGRLNKKGEEFIQIGGNDKYTVRYEFFITDPLSSKLLSRFLNNTSIWIDTDGSGRLLRMNFFGSITELKSVL